LILKSPSLALGYYGNEQATKETFVDGWLRTGDQARIDTDHEVWIVDRLKVSTVFAWNPLGFFSW
jgi:long-subunit acyl-CoA synthetase (AMP-forming)